MPHLPDFEAWAIFARVAELGSFSAAATDLALSKATVSKAVTRLEQRLGSALFHRSSRRLSLTESGRASLERAARILAEGEAIEQEVFEQAATPRGLVRLAAPMSFGMLTLGDAVRDFLAAYPMVSVDLCLSDARIDLVAEGVDIALRIGVLDDSALRARRLFDVRRPIVAAPAYLARHGRPEHPRDLEQHAFIAYTHVRNPHILHLHHPLEGDQAVRVGGRLLVNNAEVALPSLLAGEAMAVMPEFTIWQALRDGRLEEVLPGWALGPAGLYIVTPPGLRPARVTALITFLSERFVTAPWAYGVAGQEG